MAQHGKKYRQVKEKVSAETTYELAKAIEFLKSNVYSKFDETMEIVERLPIAFPPSKHNQRYLDAKRRKLGHLI